MKLALEKPLDDSSCWLSDIVRVTILKYSSGQEVYVTFFNKCDSSLKVPLLEPISTRVLHIPLGEDAAPALAEYFRVLADAAQTKVEDSDSATLHYAAVAAQLRNILNA